MNRNNLDERQEQALLKIEHNACWMSYWGLLLVIIIESIAFSVNNTNAELLKYVMGEWIVFMVIALYLSIACLRHGIWDRKLKANAKTNLIVSIVTAVVTGAYTMVFIHVKFKMSIGVTIGTGVFSFIFTFLLCYFIMALSAKAYKKKVNALEAETDEEE